MGRYHGEEIRYGGAGAEELACQIDAYNRVPLLQCHFLESGIALQASIGDQYVYGAESSDSLFKHSRDLVLG